MVNARNVRLRQSPSESAADLGVVAQGTRLTVRQRTADQAWLRVETPDNIAGWILVKEVDLGKVALDQIPISSIVVLPSATPTPNLAATAAACKPEAQVADVTVPDGTQFKPGEAFVKAWRFTSSGNCPLEKGSTLTFQGGDKMGAPDSVPVDAVDLGKSIEVSVNLKAPTTPGNYTSQWAVQRPSGQVITITNVSIVVLAPTPAATPTARPQVVATATPLAATATSGPGVIGPVGPGPLEASYVGWSGCVARLDTDTDGWVWEADFAIEVHGGSAGYTISSPNCRWDFGQRKYFCRWGGRDSEPMAQSVTISCPNCKPVKVDVFVTIKHKGPSGCE